MVWQQLVDCWLVLEVALGSVSSPLNLPITNNFLNRFKRVRTKYPISNKIVKMAMLHKETSKLVAHRTVVLKVARKEVDLVKCHRKAMLTLKGMVQKMA